MRKVYSSTVKKWAVVGGITMVPLAVLMVWYLVSLGAIQVTGYSGDVVCAGTVENPCVAYINFTAKEDIFIYPNESWKNTAFYTDPQPKDVKMYRSWGKGWREINLSQKCTGTWCGLSNKADKREFAFAFRENNSYQIKYVVLKDNPEDTIKWGFTKDVDPKFLGITKENVFTKLISNKVELTSGEAIFEINNPVDNLSLSKFLNFDFVGDSNRINSVEYFILENNSVNKTIYEYKKVIVECPKSNVSEKECYDYEKVKIGEKLVYEEKWIKRDNIPEGLNTIKLVAHWKASTEGTNVDWKPSLTFEKSIIGVNEDIKLTKDDWAWWNSTWERKKTIKVQENLNSGVPLTNYSVWFNVTYDSDMNPDFSDLRFTNGSENQELSYWMDAKLDGNWSTFWVKVPDLVLGGNQTIYMYYKNSSAVSTTSNRNTAFLYFDSFDTNPFDTRWVCWDAACGYDAGGWVTVDANSGFADAIMGYFLESFSNVEFSATMDDQVNNYWSALSVRGVSNTSGEGRIRSLYSVQTNPDHMYSVGFWINGTEWGPPYIYMPSDGYWAEPRNVSTQWFNFSSSGTTIGIAGGNYTYEYNSPNIQLYNMSDMTGTYFDNSYIHLYSRSPDTTKFDDVRVRRFVSPEPTVFISTTIEGTIDINELLVPSGSTTNTQINTAYSINTTFKSLKNITNYVNGTGYTFYDYTLKGFWNFNNDSDIQCKTGFENDTCIADISFYNYKWTVTRINATYGSMLIPTGKYDGAIMFDGKNESAGAYELLTIAYPNQPLNNLTNWTYTLWVYNNGTYASPHETYARLFYPYGYQYLLYTVSTGVCDAYFDYINLTGSGKQVFIGSYACPEEQWHHVGVRYEQLNETHFNGSLWVNGVLRTSKLIEGNYTTISGSRGMSLGMDANFPFSQFNGSIDDLQLWNRSLSPDEMYKNYLSSRTKYSSNYWGVNQTINTSVYNQSYNLCAGDTTGLIVCSPTRNIWFGTCQYSGTGNWVVNCADYCNITSAVTGDGSNLNIVGNGQFTMSENVGGFKNIYVSGGSGICNVNCYGGCFI